ncbi:MAG: guanosine monophosphate reductase [Bacteriovoracia bacterium]
MLKIRKKTFGFDDLLLVPKSTDLESRSHVDLSQTFAGLQLAYPVLSSNMDTITEFEMATAMEKFGGLGIIHRYLSEEKRLEQLSKITDLRGRALAVGITKDEIRFAKTLLDRGANILCLDVAHGHSTMMQRALGELKNYIEKTSREKMSPLPKAILIAGNVAAPEGAEALTKWGADALKVGIGPGSMCTTRIVTGSGYGQLTALADCAEATNLPIIADGGIRNSGDATKALAAGASAVMIGKLLAGTQEVPSWARNSGVYRGMASAEAQGSHYGYDFKDRHPEGVATNISQKGSVADVLGPFMGGVRSGHSYVGARNLKELREKAEFVECAPGVVVESLPHGLNPEYGREVKRT